MIRRTQYLLFFLPALLFVPPLPIRAQQGWRPGQPPPEFRVLELRGEVSLVRSGLQEVSLSTPEVAPAPQDEIQTGPDGYVRLGLQDGSHVEILANSRVQLGIPRPSWMKMIDILFGHVRIVIERIGARPSPYSFGTPTAVLGVRGTIFDVAVDENAATIVAVEDGAVRVENALYPGQSVLVKKGYRTIVRRYELPAKPERFTGSGVNSGSMAMKHGKAMDPPAGGMMSGPQSGTMHPSSGTMGMPPAGTMGNPGGMPMPGGQSGSGMPGMGRTKKKDPP